jgi:hypothetical protein
MGRSLVAQAQQSATQGPKTGSATPPRTSLAVHRVRCSARPSRPYSLPLWRVASLTRGLPYLGRRRAGARPDGWVGASRAGGFGIRRVTGSSGTRVTVAP